MNYVKSCLIITMLVGMGYPCHGDLNCDEEFNVLDIVLLANCVLAANCVDAPWCGSFCAPADVNSDGWWNVLDIVALANCVLAGNCNE